MNPERKAEILAACEAATKGPWTMAHRGRYLVDISVDNDDCKPIADCVPIPSAQFIVLARTALPEAMARIAELEELINDIGDWVDPEKCEWQGYEIVEKIQHMLYEFQHKEAQNA